MSALLALLQVASQGGSVFSALLSGTPGAGQGSGEQDAFTASFLKTLSEAKDQIEVRTHATQTAKAQDELLEALLSGDSQKIAAVFAAHPELKALKDIVLQWQQLGAPTVSEAAQQSDTSEDGLFLQADTEDASEGNADTAWLMPWVQGARQEMPEELPDGPHAELQLQPAAVLVIAPPVAAAVDVPVAVAPSTDAPVVDAPANAPLSVGTPMAAAPAAVASVVAAPVMAQASGVKEPASTSPQQPLSLGQMISQAAKEMHQKTHQGQSGNQTHTQEGGDTASAADKKAVITVAPVTGSDFQDMMMSADGTDATVSPVGTVAGKTTVDSLPIVKAPEYQPPSPQLLAKADPAEQIHIHIRQAMDQGADRIRVQLHPAELGRVEIRMELAQDGSIKLHVSAERQETLDMLQRDSRELARALQQSGLKADASGMQFSLRDESQLANWQQFSDQRDAHKQVANDSDELALDATGVATRSITAAYGLDISI